MEIGGGAGKIKHKTFANAFGNVLHVSMAYIMDLLLIRFRLRIALHSVPICSIVRRNYGVVFGL